MRLAFSNVGMISVTRKVNLKMDKLQKLVMEKIKAGTNRVKAGLIARAEELLYKTAASALGVDESTFREASSMLGDLHSGETANSYENFTAYMSKLSKGGDANPFRIQLRKFMEKVQESGNPTEVLTELIEVGSMELDEASFVGEGGDEQLLPDSFWHSVRSGQRGIQGLSSKSQAYGDEDLEMLEEIKRHNLAAEQSVKEMFYENPEMTNEELFRNMQGHSKGSQIPADMSIAEYEALPKWKGIRKMAQYEPYWDEARAEAAKLYSEWTMVHPTEEIEMVDLLADKRNKTFLSKDVEMKNVSGEGHIERDPWGDDNPEFTSAETIAVRQDAYNQWVEENPLEHELRRVGFPAQGRGTRVFSVGQVRENG